MFLVVFCEEYTFLFLLHCPLSVAFSDLWETIFHHKPKLLISFLTWCHKVPLNKIKTNYTFVIR